jgi:hypothetical protein
LKVLESELISLGSHREFQKVLDILILSVKIAAEDDGGIELEPNILGGEVLAKLEDNVLNILFADDLTLTHGIPDLDVVPFGRH